MKLLTRILNFFAPAKLRKQDEPSFEGQPIPTLYDHQEFYLQNAIGERRSYRRCKKCGFEEYRNHEDDSYTWHLSQTPVNDKCVIYKPKS